MTAYTTRNEAVLAEVVAPIEPGSSCNARGRGYERCNSNPLLVAFREALAHSATGRTSPELAAAWLEEPWPKCLTPEQIDHARKVLGRLTAL